VGATALLEWRLVEGGPAPSREALLVASGGVVPADADVTVEAARSGDASGSSYYLVRKVPVVTGRDLRNARASLDEYSRPAVSFSLTRDATRQFATFTRGHVGRQLAILLDGRVQSAPVVEGPIDSGEGIIRGRFSAQEAADLSLVLRAGALPASMTYLGGGFVGPTLGSASVRTGMAASLAGLGLVTAFMLLYYNRAGLNAAVSVAINLLLLLGSMAYAGGALTLPGIAGLILTIGMGVDSNVLIFERIKEELARGRPARAAVAAGFDRVFLTILDTHIASLIAAAFLFQFGTGPIRGFATALTFGLLSNLFTAVFVSRTLFEVQLARRHGQLRIETFAHRLRAPRIDVHRRRWPAASLSLLAIALGIGLMTVRGVPLGIDFAGGTLLNVAFESPVTEEAIHEALAGDEVVQRFGDPSDNAVLIRIPQKGDAGDVSAIVDRAVAELKGGELPAFEVAGSETVGPAVGASLQRKGLYATAASLAGITGYIALRFRPAFAVGAIVATCHDVLLTTSILTACGYELSLNVVAALLTITGYSVNDTIVTFDRIRENLRALPRLPLAHIANLAVSQTLGRTMITGGTTFMAVLALYLLGGEVLEGFSFAMLVGIAIGTYSTIFVATGLALMFSGHDDTKKGPRRTR
jgi:protein-export membrane protein SecD/preprotein translocase SecF subunit